MVREIRYIPVTQWVVGLKPQNVMEFTACQYRWQKPTHQFPKMPISCLNISVTDKKKTDYVEASVLSISSFCPLYCTKCNKGLLCMVTVYPHFMVITGTKSCWHWNIFSNCCVGILSLVGQAVQGCQPAARMGAVTTRLPLLSVQDLAPTCAPKIPAILGTPEAICTNSIWLPSILLT